MEMLKVMLNRHSVRSYLDTPIETDTREKLDELVTKLNEESGLNIQILYDEMKCFSSMMAHYGKFINVRNYVSLSGPKGKELDEKVGYYGELLVLKMAELGLDSCWVALTHGKSRASLKKGHKERCLIAIGYGVHHGFPHKVKRIEEVSDYQEGMPEWYAEGIKAALLAPSALNQQRFRFYYKDGKVSAKAGKSFYGKMDLGIAKCHFELISGHRVD